MQSWNSYWMGDRLQCPKLARISSPPHDCDESSKLIFTNRLIPTTSPPIGLGSRVKGRIWAKKQLLYLWFGILRHFLLMKSVPLWHNQSVFRTSPSTQSTTVYIDCLSIIKTKFWHFQNKFSVFPNLYSSPPCILFL